LLALLHGFIAFRSDSLAVAAELAHNSEAKWLTGRSAGRFRFVEAGVALRCARSPAGGWSWTFALGWGRSFLN
jgi:hypothetical protein